MTGVNKAVKVQPAFSDRIARDEKRADRCDQSNNRNNVIHVNGIIIRIGIEFFHLMLP